MDEHHDQALAAHLKAMRKMSDAFWRVSDIYNSNGVPADVIASVFFGASLDSLLVVFDRETVLELMRDAIEAVEQLDEGAQKVDILDCVGSA